MRVLLIIIEVALFSLLIIIGAFRLRRPQGGSEKIGGNKSRKALPRSLQERNYRLVNGLRSVLLGFLIIIYVVILTTLTTGVWIILIPLLTVYLAYVLFRMKFIKKLSSSLFFVKQEKVVKFIDRHYKFINKLVAEEPKDEEYEISSEDELRDVIEKSELYLDDKQAKLLLSALDFKNLTIKDVMINKSNIPNLKSNEVLGPLTLHELSKSGQRYALVFGKNINDIKGVLNLNDLLVIEGGDNNLGTALDAVTGPVSYVMQNTSLDQALGMMLKSGKEALIVTGKSNNIVGLVSLGAILKKLIPTLDGQSK